MSLAARPICEDDDVGVRAFHAQLTPETTRMRFFSPHPRLSDAETRRFTHVDHHDREAVAVLDGDEIVGVARYERLGTTAEAEVAFVVAERFRKQGIGTELLSRIAKRARSEGIIGLVADTLAENGEMIRIFERSGMVTKRTLDDAVVHIEMSITP